jgi:hypothetical protein
VREVGGLTEKRAYQIRDTIFAHLRTMAAVVPTWGDGYMVHAETPSGQVVTIKDEKSWQTFRRAYRQATEYALLEVGEATVKEEKTDDST